MASNPDGRVLDIWFLKVRLMISVVRPSVDGIEPNFPFTLDFILEAADLHLKL